MIIPSIFSTTTRIIRKRLSCAILALSFFCAFAAGESIEDALTVGMISTTTAVTNPLNPIEREFISLTSLIYEGLIEIDDDYMPQPCLAESWEVSSSGTVWYFYLHEGITFADGSPLTAHDVVATANEILRLAEEGKGYYASLRYMISEISASDNLTVVIKTSRANYGFLYAMTFPVLPAAQVQTDFPSGTGPYFSDIFVPGDYMLLTANPAWWQGTPGIYQIMSVFHAASRDLVESYEYSRVDAVITRTITAAQYRAGVSNYNIDYRTRQLETLLMNNRSVELQDIRVRKAIRCAVDIDTLASDAYFGMVTRTNTPMISGTWMYQDNDTAYVYNPEKARALLDEAGWIDSDEDGIRDTVRDGKQANLVLRMYVYEEQDNSVRVETANLIKEMLSEVGISVNVTTMTYSETESKLSAGSFDLCLAAYNMDAVPDPGFLLMSGNTGNYSRYKSDVMDDLFKKLRTSLDFNAYRQTLREIQSLFAEDCPFICLYYRNGAVLTREMFTDVRDVREPEVLRGIEDFDMK